MGRFKTGLCSVSFRKNTAEEIIDAAVRARLGYIEWGSDVHAPCRDLDRLQKIAELQRECGVSVSSYGTYFRFGQNDLSELRDYFAAARVLGTDELRLWCGTKGSANFSTEEKENLFESCRTAARMAEAEGMTISMECHQWTFTDTAESIVELMGAVESPAFRMYWQPNQYRAVEENLSHLKMTAQYVTNIHIFNWEGDKRYPLTDAADTWRKYLSMIDGAHSVLLEFLPDDNIDSLGREAEALKIITDGIN